MNIETVKLLKYLVQALFLLAVFALVIFNLDAFLTLVAAIVAVGGSLIAGAFAIVVFVFLFLLVISG